MAARNLHIDIQNRTLNDEALSRSEDTGDSCRAQVADVGCSAKVHGMKADKLKQAGVK